MKGSVGQGLMRVIEEQINTRDYMHVLCSRHKHRHNYLGKGSNEPRNEPEYILV